MSLQSSLLPKVICQFSQYILRPCKCFHPLMYNSSKAMAALVQPVGDKRLNECVAAVAEGVGLLLKIMVSSSMLFFLTIAIVTASLGK